MKNAVSFRYKFLRTHHACGACYHFGTGILSESKMQCTTQRVNSKRDLFKALTSVIPIPKCQASPYQSDSMRRRVMCEGICNRKIIHFSYYCKYGILFFGDDGTAPADESKRTKRVQGWSRQIMGGGAFYYLQYNYFGNNHVIRVNMHTKRVDCLYNSINRNVQVQPRSKPAES